MKSKLWILSVSLLASGFCSHAQNWSQWTRLPNSANADVSISFLEVNTCKSFNYCYYRTNNNSLFAGGSYVYGEFSYHGCDGQVTTEHFYIYLDKKGVVQAKGNWYLSNGSGVFNVKVDNVSIAGKGNGSSNSKSSNSSTANNSSAPTSSTQPQNNNEPQQSVAASNYSMRQSAQLDAVQQKINLNTARAQEQSQKVQAIGNAAISAGADIYNAIHENKVRKEEYWNSLTPEEQQAIIESNRRADSIKSENKKANDQEEIEAISGHGFSIGIYGALESRDFNASDISEFYNRDGYDKTIPVLLNVKQPAGYNVGLNFEWASDNTRGLGKNTRRGLLSIGIYYITYSAPMVINQNYDSSTIFDGNVAVLKFRSVRVAPSVSVRLFRLGRPSSLSGVFFQWGLKADYMFSATANPATFDKYAITTGYNSVTTKFNIANHFKKLEAGMTLGLRVDLSRHVHLNLQYDILGGLNDQVLKAKYSGDDEWYTFQERHKTTVGLGISF